MATVDFKHLSSEERLDLIGELWHSLAPSAVHLTTGQRSEIHRRMASLEDDIAQGRDAAEVLADLRRP